MKRNCVQSSNGGGRALAVLVLGGFLSGCGPRETATVPAPPPGSASPVVAHVGSQVLTVDDVLREVERRQLARRSVPAKEALVRDMASMLALAEHARATGLDRDPEVTREVNALLARRLLEREIAARSKEGQEPTAAEIESEYQRTAEKFTRPALSRLALLFLEVPKNASPASRQGLRERLESVRREMVQGGMPAADALATGFGARAVSHSDDVSSRHRGGDVGWLEDGNYSYRWPKEVLQAAHALEVGGLSDVLESDKGVYLVMKTDTRRAMTQPIAEVESQVRASLVASRRQAAESSLCRELSEQFPVRLDEAALAAMNMPEPVAPKAPRRGEVHAPQLSHFDPPRH